MSGEQQHVTMEAMKEAMKELIGKLLDEKLDERWGKMNRTYKENEAQKKRIKDMEYQVEELEIYTRKNNVVQGMSTK